MILVGALESTKAVCQMKRYLILFVWFHLRSNYLKSCYPHQLHGWTIHTWEFHNLPSSWGSFQLNPKTHDVKIEKYHPSAVNPLQSIIPRISELALKQLHQRTLVISESKSEALLSCFSSRWMFTISGHLPPLLLAPKWIKRKTTTEKTGNTERGAPNADVHGGTDGISKENKTML